MHPIINQTKLKTTIGILTSATATSDTNLPKMTYIGNRLCAWPPPLKVLEIEIVIWILQIQEQNQLTAQNKFRIQNPAIETISIKERERTKLTKEN